MIPLTPETAFHVRRALAAYQHLRLTDGQPIPTVWPALIALAADLERQTPELLTLDQAAERARVSLRTLRRWRADGLPTVRRGTRKLIPTAALDQWADR